MRIHTGTKPYECDFDGCHQRFNTSGNLSRHKRIHSGERPYPCVFSACGKRFNTSTKLKRHMRIHFPDSPNLFQCVQPGCAFACDNYKEYVHHQRQHGNPAFAEPVKPQDENVDRSNHLPSAKSKPKTTAQARARHQGRDAAARDLGRLGTQPAAQGDRGAAQRRARGRRGRRGRVRPPPAPAGSSSRTDRPRLPFPTEAFPSEGSIVSASPMSSAPSTFSASFPHSYLSHHQHQHQQHQHLPLRSSFFDQNPLSSSASSYTSSSTTSTTTSFAYLRGTERGRV
ncbi:hypothetical protein PINS_up019883 [Pythium insidiosum]|nr:hypothetical protein PINS_up019883 [Pythium insidiosum]